MTWHGRFLGAAEDIGRLGFVLEADGHRFLFDYGMEPDKPPLYPLEAPPVDRVFLTHAHLDHSGMLPWLAARYDASIHCTPPSAEVATLQALEGGMGGYLGLEPVFFVDIEPLIGAFTPELIRSFEGYGDPSNLPVFVVGMPRSGTTLTEQIIAAHPKGGGAGELRRISWMWLGLSESKTAAHAFRKMRDGGPQRCRDLASRYVSQIPARAARFCSPLLDGASRISLRNGRPAPDHALEAL